MHFFVTLRSADHAEPMIDALPFDSLEAAYLDACAAIPSAAADLLRERRNPFRCAFLIHDGEGALLMEVPFTDVLSPSERDREIRRPAAAWPSAETRLQVQIARSRRLMQEAAALHRRTAAFVAAFPRGGRATSMAS